MEERKGILTPKQEKLLDELYESDNPVIEAGDGMVIQIADNQGMQKLKERMEIKYPGVSQEFIYPIVDGLMEIVKTIVENRDTE